MANTNRLSVHLVIHSREVATCHYLQVNTCETLQNNLQGLKITHTQNMDLSDKERYSISKVGKDTFVLTDADTLQTWQIEILRNSYKEEETEVLNKNTPSKCE